MNEVTTRDDVRKALLNYLDTDTIWYGSSFYGIRTHSPNLRLASFHQDYPESLVRLQDDHWTPLITWARDTFGVELLTSDSVLFSAQPAATRRKFDEVLQGFDPWQMAGCVLLLVFSPVIY
jgi:ATP synthase F1 complex assembly factor 2